MNNEQLQRVLNELYFSADLPPEILNKLAAESRVERVPAADVVFREGGCNESLFLVRKGRLALEMNVPGRGVIRILTVGPGEMAGWSSLLSNGKMTASAVAVEDSELVVAPASRLRSLCESDTVFGFHLMRRMATALSRRLVATRLQLLDLFGDTASPADKAESNG